MYIEGRYIPQYGVLVPLLIPVTVGVIGLGGAPSSFCIMMVIVRFLEMLLWIQKSYEGLWNMIYILNDDEVNSTVVLFYITYYCALISNFYHPNIYPEYSVPVWPEWSNEMIDIFEHICGVMV